jgi:hypothetical protein
MGTRVADDLAPLAAMRATLDTFLLAVDWMANEWGGDFADPSPARTMWTSCAERYAGDLEDAYRMAMDRWHGVRDLARGFVVMIDHELPFSTIAASRSLADNAARAWYLVEDGIEPIERVRRLINDRLHASWNDSPVHAGPAVRDLLDRGARYGLTLGGAASASRPPVLGAPRPSSAAVIALALGSPLRVATFHRLTSAVVHADTPAVPRRLFSRESDGEYRSRTRPLDGAELADAVGVAVGTLVNAADAVSVAAGWDVGTLVRTADRLHQAWDQPPAA